MLAFTCCDRRRVGGPVDLQLVAIQRLAVGIEHRAHGFQRCAEAAVGQAVVDLCHFHRRESDRAQQHGRQCGAVRFAAPSACIRPATFFVPHVHAERTVGVFSDSASARTAVTGPAVLVIVVLRAPGLAGVELDVQSARLRAWLRRVYRPDSKPAR